MASFHDFPKDVWVEIMLWLPPESLKRFKRVCNSWNALINDLIRDPEFVAKHLRNMKIKSVSSPTLCFRDLYAINSTDFEECNSSDRTYLLTVIDGEDCDSCDYIPCALHGFDFRYGQLYDYLFGVVSQCNGVVCFRDCDSKGRDLVFLVNPSLRELKAIPNPFPYYNDDYDDGDYAYYNDDDDDYAYYNDDGDDDYAYYNDDDENQLLVVGFGYDPGADDYKVVVIRCEKFFRTRAKVYSLSENTWKKINCNLQVAKMSLYNYQSVYCNGVCYWFFCVEPRNIVSFDLHGEVFHDIPYPGVVKSRSLRVFDKIAVWNDSLALCSYTEVDMLVIDMWVLDSKSVEGTCSWTKHMTIGPLAYVCHPQAFMPDGELLLLETEDNRTVVTYNLCTRELGGYSKHLQGPRKRLVPSTKSLVSVLKSRCYVT